MNQQNAFVRANDWAFEFSTLAQVEPVGQAQQSSPGSSNGNSGQAGPSPTSSMVTMLLPILLLVGFYFLLVRPQQRKARELNDKLKKGDRVLTNSGLVGTIVSISEKRCLVEIASGIKVEMLRSAIAGIDEGDAPTKSSEPASAKQ